eukprot:5342981-Ditylum_brightwellii.AAC.1
MAGIGKYIVRNYVTGRQNRREGGANKVPWCSQRILSLMGIGGPFGHKYLLIQIGGRLSEVSTLAK